MPALHFPDITLGRCRTTHRDTIYSSVAYGLLSLSVPDRRSGGHLNSVLPVALGLVGRGAAGRRIGLMGVKMAGWRAFIGCTKS